MKRVTALLSLGLVVGLASWTPTLLGRDHSAKERIEVFKVPVWVRNGTGYQTDLSVGDFQVFEGRDRLKVSSFRKPDSPMLLFIAFDTVGEIAIINQARTALGEHLRRLDPQYWVGLISAQEQIVVLQDPTPDRAIVEQKIAALAQIGKAGLLESIQSVADLTTGILLHSDVRVAVIFITDSDIGNYRADYLNPPVNASDSRDLSRRFAGRALQERISRTAFALSRFQAPIFIVHIDPGKDPLNRAYQNGLKQFAETVGGQLFLSKTVGDIPAVMQEAFQWVQSFYLLGLDVPGTRSGFFRIQISVSQDPPSSPAGRLTYPMRLFFP